MRGRLLLLLVVVLAVPTLLWPGGAIAGPAYLAGLGVVVAALWRGSRRWQGAARRGWTFVAAAASCWLAGDLVQRLAELVGRPFDQAGPADVCWLASYPLLVLGVVSMLRGRGLPAPLWREIRLDVATVTVAGAAGAWRLMIQPSTAGGGLSVDAVVAVLYPLGDVAILAVGLALLMTPGRRTTASAFVLSCFGLTLLLDTAYVVLPEVAASFDVARLDGVLLVVNGLLAAAVVHPHGDELAAPPVDDEGPSRVPRWRVLVLGGALVFVTVVPGLPGARAGGLDRAVLLAAASAVSVTILRRVYGVMRDRDAAEELLIFRAHHDELTGLANRALLVERVRRELRAVGTGIALCYLDLDGFKAVNDARGHAAGDQVLRTVAQRLRALVRPADTPARLGGDEFVVLFVGVDRSTTESLVRELRTALCRPIDLADGGRVSVGVSIGVQLVGTDAAEGTRPDDVDRLLRLADAAMYDAKHAGGGVRVA